MIFFFSSRRRHTRLTCDWSSDVCSSDLDRGMQVRMRQALDLVHVVRRDQLARAGALEIPDRVHAFQIAGLEIVIHRPPRSEERRVGKECGARWSPDGSKEKL